MAKLPLVDEQHLRTNENCMKSLLGIVSLLGVAVVYLLARLAGKAWKIPYTDPMPSIDSTTTPVPEAPKQPVVPLSYPRATLDTFCTCIRDYEGKPGDRNYRNNNPGNCRYSAVGYLKIYQPVLRDKDNFAVFRDYATGWLYLENLVKYKIHQNPNQSVLDFFKGYSPKDDGNDPVLYSKYVAAHMGVDNTYRLGDLQGL